MNCFWIVSLIYRTQLDYTYFTGELCCELLLNCIFDLSDTALIAAYILVGALWIAFELYLWFIGHSGLRRGLIHRAVVNCFWIVSLIYRTQLFWRNKLDNFCCELLLNCIFDLSDTAIAQHRLLCGELWIAFELYLWFIGHSIRVHGGVLPSVVNCFWIVSLIYRTQQVISASETHVRCELLLNCIFDLSDTACWHINSIFTPLWIAFELYLWFIGHSEASVLGSVLTVVNCFWIVSLIYRTQRANHQSVLVRCCELLLNCIFDLSDTASNGTVWRKLPLWIAFELYLWFIGHSTPYWKPRQMRVVNCFWIVSLIYRTQPYRHRWQ